MSSMSASVLALPVTQRVIPTLPTLPSHWQAKVPLEIVQSRYIIKTADSADEFAKTIALRNEVFLKEFAGKDEEPGELLCDLEARDQDADFLIIKEAGTGDVLASYRLICSKFSRDFYSKSEFSLGSFLDEEGTKLELSRACVRADKRSSGILVHLLWRGLVAYIQATGSRYLFGCSSVQYLHLPELVKVYRQLNALNALTEAFHVKPLPEYKILDTEGLRLMNPQASESAIDLPPLLLAYVRAGAKIHGAPAYDQDFGCLDLFTVLDFDNLDSAFAKRYLT